MDRKQALNIWRTVAQGSPIVTGRALEAFANAVEAQYLVTITENLNKEMIDKKQDPNEMPSGTIF